MSIFFEREGSVMADFANRLKLLRKERNLKAEEIAEILNSKKRIVFSYEKNEAKPSFERLLKLADYFDVSLDYLVGRSDIRERRQI